MYAAIDKFMEGDNNKISLHAICIGIAFLIGFLDFATGYEISFFIFYALPIAFSAWYGDKRSATMTVFLCITVWGVADIFTGHEYTYPFIPYWNGMIRFAFFMFTAHAIVNMREKLTLEQSHAKTDSLTGVLNSRGFFERVEAMIPLLQRETKPYGLCFIDVDNFKTVNDTKGHAEGDLILKTIAAVMQSSMRSSDVVGRIGGDEFVIFLPRTDGQNGLMTIEKLKSRLDEEAARRHWPIGFSLGLGVVENPATPVQDAVRFADNLMYDVKKSSKDRILCKTMDGGAFPVLKTA